MKIGNISINVPAVANIKEEEFYEMVKGNIGVDKKDAWKAFLKAAEPFRKKDNAEKAKD